MGACLVEDCVQGPHADSPRQPLRHNAEAALHRHEVRSRESRTLRGGQPANGAFELHTSWMTVATIEMTPIATNTSDQTRTCDSVLKLTRPERGVSICCS